MTSEEVGYVIQWSVLLSLCSFIFGYRLKFTYHEKRTEQGNNFTRKSQIKCTFEGELVKFQLELRKLIIVTIIRFFFRKKITLELDTPVKINISSLSFL